MAKALVAMHTSAMTYDNDLATAAVSMPSAVMTAAMLNNDSLCAWPPLFSRNWIRLIEELETRLGAFVG
jgi:hypothetical protein